jgi:transcriptional regulator with XRE-family HTH domain
MTQIGETLKAWRTAARVTLREAGEAAGVSYTYVSKIEHGHLEPSVELVERLARLYRRSPVDADTALLAWGRLPSWVVPLLTANPYLVHGLRLQRSRHAPFVQRTPPEYA